MIQSRVENVFHLLESVFSRSLKPNHPTQGACRRMNLTTYLVEFNLVTFEGITVGRRVRLRTLWACRAEYMIF